MLTVFGIRKENGKRVTVAHSLAVYRLDGKLGAIGKAGSDDMRNLEPKYENIDSVALDLILPFFNRGILVTQYFREDETNFYKLFDGDQNFTCSHNEIFINKEKKDLKISVVKDFLTKNRGVESQVFEDFLADLHE